MEKETSRGGRDREGGDGREVGEAVGGSGRNLVKGMGMLAAVIGVWRMGWRIWVLNSV